MVSKAIIEMAREVGIDWHRHWNDDESNRLEQFAELVRAYEREACAKVCEEQEYRYWRATEDQDFTPQDCADAIRARGNT